MAPKEDGKTEHLDNHEGRGKKEHPEEYESRAKKDEYEDHPELILGGLSRIMKTSLLIPLDVVQMRLRYPDTWCVKMFRIMVNCKGCPGPYEVLTAGMLQKRTYASLRWGIYYCLYDAHRRICIKKGYEPLCQSTFLLKGRDIVLHAVELAPAVEVLDYLHERRRSRESKVVQQWLESITSLVHSAVQTALSQDWNVDALAAA